MAETQSRQSFCRNFALTGGNKLAEEASTKKNHFLTLGEFPA